MVSNLGESDNQSHVNQEPNKKQVYSEVFNSQNSSIIFKVQQLKGDIEIGRPKRFK